MPSSTSNSNSVPLEVPNPHHDPLGMNENGRVIPTQSWGRIGTAVLVLVILFMAAWELFARSLGYTASYNDTPGLWALWRNKVGGADQVVLVGSSRIRFNLKHKPVSKLFGGAEVINLAMNGSVARPVLHDLAQDANFSGTVICDYTPNLFWAPGGPNMDSTLEFVNYRPKESPSNWLEQRVLLVPDSMLAFVQKDDLALNPLLGRFIPLPNRPGTRLPPRLPFYFQHNDFQRHETMWSKFEQSPAMQEDMKSIWTGLLAFAQPLPPPLVDQLMGEVVADVNAIQARGGRVLFVCFPSTGKYREIEEQTIPRAPYWDRLLKETGCLGIHFEDYPELSQFDCPEWSHLTAADSEKFTQALVAILAEKLAENSRTQ